MKRKVIITCYIILIAVCSIYVLISSLNGDKPLIIKTAEGKAYNIGDTIKIKNQTFYVIEASSEEDTTIKAVSQKAIDTKSNKQKMAATNVSFSSKNYWNKNSKLIDTYGTKYPAIVYDENSNMYELVNNYVKSLDIEGIEGTILSLDDVFNLGCEKSSLSCLDSEYKWIYQAKEDSFVNYWLSSANTATKIFVINQGKIVAEKHSTDTYFKIRPVITVEKSKIILD